jgi:4-nitrophenyl phosphatase
LNPQVIKRIKNASGFIFDMDGTIALGDAASGGHRALPFAPETLAAIRALGIPFRVYTNGSAKAPATYAASLRNAGFDLRDGEMMTPSSSAAVWFVKKGITRVRVLGNEGVGAPLRDAGITVIGPSEKASDVEAVYTGWYREFTFPDMEAACESVWDGAILTTASHVPFFATATGRAIGASFAINAMVTAMTGKRPKVLGKPSRTAFDATARDMGIGAAASKNIIVVGDDPSLEMRMANGAGAVSIGMTTGLMKREGLAALSPDETPMALLDTLEPMLKLLK